MFQKFKNSQTWMAVFLLITGLLIRAYYIFEYHDAEKYIFSDMGGYLQHAQNFLAGKVEDSFFFQPIGLPLIEAFFLNLTGGLFAFKWLQLTLSVLTLIFVWRTAIRLFSSSQDLESWTSLPNLILAFAVFHFPLIFFSGIFLAENTFIFILSILIWMLAHSEFPFSLRKSVAFGMIFGLAFLMKTSAILVWPLIALWTLAAILKKQIPFKASLLSFLVSSIVFGGILIGHGFWSSEKIGKFLLSPTSGGLNLVEGKCPSKENRDSAGYMWKSPLFTQLQEGESKKWDEAFTNSKYFTQQALLCVKDRPQVLIESLRYIPYLFINNDLWPSLNTRNDQKMTSRNYSLYFALIAIPGILWALILLSQNFFTAPARALVLPAISIFIMVWLFKSEVRLRGPFDLVFIPLSMMGWSHSLQLLMPQFTKVQIHRFLMIFTLSFGFIFTAGLFYF